jgi:hypothetical protein
LLNRLKDWQGKASTTSDHVLMDAECSDRSTTIGTDQHHLNTIGGSISWVNRFIFNEWTLGWFSDARSYLNAMQVSALVAYIFNMHPPIGIHFGDYPNIYLIKAPA